jgi:hypothetical protein
MTFSLTLCMVKLKRSILFIRMSYPKFHRQTTIIHSYYSSDLLLKVTHLDLPRAIIREVQLDSDSIFV